ncbi:unnamed protein product [Rhizoctonia solani]|uniref:Zn(2)-C6 fungal-type domain-containing protein n=1 Tax=Rhizoctonia solani TaxID=456999 RepID=A0A8H3E0T4_9AGAM|nr:unnamed protein product [Rhizoctonia solani]
MAIKHKSTPGPRAESCLTCRQRRKKCDKVRPFCQRCLNSKGRFFCLGYDIDDEPELETEMPPRKTWKESAEVEPVTVIPPLRVGVEFGDAVVRVPELPILVSPSQQRK